MGDVVGGGDLVGARDSTAVFFESGFKRVPKAQSLSHSSFDVEGYDYMGIGNGSGQLSYVVEHDLIRLGRRCR